MKRSGVVDYILELLEPLGATARGMFGGYGLYRNGTIFAIIVEDQLYFKVSDANRTDYEQAGSIPFSYESRGKKVSMTYWTVPAEILDDQDALCTWAEKAYKVACLTAKPKKRSRK